MSDDDARDRAAILARRNRFVTAALSGLAGVAGTTLATACPCLDYPAPDYPAPAEPSTKEAPTDAKTDADDTAPPSTDAKTEPPQP
jgi:hypothetical protein